MEPAQAPVKEPLRVRIVLGKFQVKQLVQGKTGGVMTVDMTNGVSMRCEVPTVADVRLGDYLTFYTEVLADPSKLTTPMTTG